MATRLRDARIAAGLPSARQAATKHGFGISTYTAHENGQNDYSPEMAAIYAKAFDVRAEWLLFGTQERTDDEIGIDRQLRALPRDVSRDLVERFNLLIEGVKLGRKIK